MKIKNAFRWIMTFFQVVIAIFAIAIHSLSDNRMGVMRSLTYRNEVYDKLFLNVKITYGLIFTLVLLLILAFRFYKKSNRFKYSLLFIVFNLVVIILAIKLNGDIVLSYYVLLVSAFAVLIIQSIKFIIT